jgi:uncharacterized protein (TIGR03000 family)
MYTVVLMAAMSAGEANPQWLFNHGCCGNSCSSCSCYSGCGGGGWFGHHGCVCGGGHYAGTPFMGMCAGSYWDGAPGYGAYGCMGPGYCGGGCNGGYPSAGYAAGWPGAYGSCYGYGGGYGGLTSFTCGGNYGCYGGYACYGLPNATEGNAIYPPAAPMPGAPIPSSTPAPAPMVAPPMPPKASLDGKIRSRVIIETPENAKLYVDGQLMQTASTHRVFQTPELTPGSTYFYDLKVEVVQAGKTMTEEKRIYVRPGIEQTVAFSTPTVPSDIATVSAGRE